MLSHLRCFHSNSSRPLHTTDKRTRTRSTVELLHYETPDMLTPRQTLISITVGNVFDSVFMSQQEGSVQ